MPHQADPGQRQEIQTLFLASSSTLSKTQLGCVQYGLYFIRWFFGDWWVRGAEQGDQVDEDEIEWDSEVCLFFGEWSEDEIVNARSRVEKYTWNEQSGIWDPGEGLEYIP
ncbi:hypothetical protein BT69DRAFT_1303606 [Atractiella rhizophila]|nr:hypothetical protein BT69DRAFT_1303606 [Atractiella rhizophila]